MSAQGLEAFLAHLYTDVRLRAAFRVNPQAEAKKWGLSDEECRSLEAFDWAGLELTARSFARKRQQRSHARIFRLLWSVVFRC